MIKKVISNIYLLTGRFSLTLAILALAAPGCKKKEAAPVPPAAQVQPLPKRAVQANSSAAKQLLTQPKGAVPATPATVAPPPPKPAVPAPAKVPAPAAGQLPIQKQISSPRLTPPPGTVNLDFASRKDPFKPFVQATPAQQGNEGKAGRPPKEELPIQRFDVEKFKISGIITGIKENSALVLDPTGKGYVVKAGMQIGNNDGRIKRITNSSLEVEETVTDDRGKSKKRLVKLMLIRKK